MWIRKLSGLRGKAELNDGLSPLVGKLPISSVLDLDLECDWLADNMLPGENQSIFHIVIFMMYINILQNSAILLDYFCLS